MHLNSTRHVQNSLCICCLLLATNSLDTVHTRTDALFSHVGIVALVTLLNVAKKKCHQYWCTSLEIPDGINGNWKLHPAKSRSRKGGRPWAAQWQWRSRMMRHMVLILKIWSSVRTMRSWRRAWWRGRVALVSCQSEKSSLMSCRS